MTRFSKAKSNDESEEESHQPNEDRKGKVVPESTMMKKGYLRTKMNSQVQGSECDDDDMPSLKRMSIYVIKQKPNIKGRVKDLDLNDNKAESDSKNVKDYYAKCFGLFGEDKSTKGKIAPKSGPVQESYPRVNVKFEPRKLRCNHDDTFLLKGIMSAIVDKEREIGSGSQLEQSRKITQTHNIIDKKHNLEFMCAIRYNGKKGYKSLNTNNPAMIKEIKNELGIMISNGNSNLDVCTIESPCDIQPSDTPPPWKTC
ncbi:2732_t:CDS:2 [Acaulospora morrowiae]|uniref:2732_t:CDS:1 n=1 Tax=Acaulospora morrowiae TaxID=94023 RepID=A0A9N9G180_9GLOM|nr:2732_t:CDS:2 [Acaulospora morrowiae]